jgi:hypothetical protein
MSATVLERIVTERDEVRSAAIAIAESDDFSPDDKTFIDLQTRASELDKRAATLAGLIEQQQAADALDAKFGKAQKRSEQRSPTTTETRGETWGEAFVRSDVFRDYPGRGNSGKFEVEMRALPATLAAMADALPSVPVYDLTPPQLPPSILPLATVINTAQNSVDYLHFEKETAPAAPLSSAKIVPEGTVKPEVSWRPVVDSASLVTIAARTSYSRQLAADASAVVSYINSELSREVSRKIEEEAQAALAAADLDSVTGASLLAAIRMGMARVQGQGYSPNGFTVAADDLAALDLESMEAGTSGPSRTGAFWGLTPIIDWTKDAGDPIHVGDFKAGIVHYRRTTVELFTTDSNRDHWELNVLDTLAEARCLTRVVRPAAIVEATGA